jgi:hypothetical protein
MLEIDPGSDPISGRLQHDGHPAHEFVGWLGLARALELTLDEPAPSPPGSPPPA